MIVQLRIKCPLCMKDSILNVSDLARAVKLPCCENWYSIQELKALKTEVFVPPLIRSMYEGAVHTTKSKYTDPVEQCWNGEFRPVDFHRQIL
jgi:hypothetical protein